ncbi:MAG TPA: GtrA family protein [Chloroflexia bacterium]|nr:GtrA family protein [Chloroflexia bacterium]
MAKLRRVAPAFGRFLVVGLSGTVVNLTVLWVLVNLGLPQIVASLLAIQVSIINNFILNDRWTFRQHSLESAHSIWARFVRFELVSSMTAALTIGLFSMFNYGLHLHYMLAQLLAIGVATVLNFSVNSWLTWGLFKPSAGVKTVPVPVRFSEVQLSKDLD